MYFDAIRQHVHFISIQWKSFELNSLLHFFTFSEIFSPSYCCYCHQWTSIHHFFQKRSGWINATSWRLTWMDESSQRIQNMPKFSRIFLVILDRKLPYNVWNSPICYCRAKSRGEYKRFCWKTKENFSWISKQSHSKELLITFASKFACSKSAHAHTLFSAVDACSVAVTSCVAVWSSHLVTNSKRVYLPPMKMRGGRVF